MIEKIAFIRGIYEPDGAGGQIYTDVVIWEPQGAKVEQVSINNEIIASQENINTVIKVTCRYNPEIDILAGDKILWRGYLFNGLRPKVDRIKRTMVIMATAQKESTAFSHTTS